MRISFPEVGPHPVISRAAVSDAGILVPANNARVSVDITLVAGGPFYIKCGSGASATSWRFQTGTTAGTIVTIADYRGDITVSPAVLINQLHRCENTTTR